MLPAFLRNGRNDCDGCFGGIRFTVATVAAVAPSYNYPKYDETSGYVQVPSQQLSDAMVEAFKDRLKVDHK